MMRLFRFVSRYPVTIIVSFLALLAGALVLHARQARYDFSFEQMAPKETIEYQRFKEFTAIFGEDEDLFMIAFRDDPLVTNENLTMIERITGRLEALDATGSVNSLTNVKDIRGNGDTLEVEDFIGELPLGPADLEGARERLIADPIVAGSLISREGDATAIVGRMAASSADPNDRRAYFSQVEQILAEEGKGLVDFHLAGIPYMDAVMIAHIESDTSTFIPISLLVLGGLLWLGFGQARAAWMCVMPIAISATMTLGVLSLLDLPMTVLTGQGVLTTLIFVIGLADGVHLLNRYAEDAHTSAGASDRPALARTMRHIGVACLLTSVTTAIGFASLAMSDIATIRDFGILGAVGVALAYAAAILFMPACIVLADRRRPMLPRSIDGGDVLARLLAHVSRIVVDRPRSCLAVGLVVLAVSVAASFRVVIDNRFTRDLYPSDPAVVSLRFLEAELGGAFPVEILVKGSRADAIKDPAVLAAMEKVRTGLEELPQISKITSPAPFIKKMNRAMNEDSEASYRLPETSNAVAQYLLLYEMAGSDSEFDRLVNYDYSVARMTALMRDGPPSQYQQVVARLHELADGAFPPGIEVYESGGEPLFYSVTVRLISTLIRSLYYAMPLILLTIVIAFRSLRFGLISVLPNLIPITVGMGLLGLTGISLRFSTMIGFPVAFGLAVDDTIHFLARYRKETEAGRSPAEAVQETLRTTGRGMVMTSLFLIAGYFIMFLSNYLAVLHMGIVICAILAAALLSDLFVTPALVLLFPSLVRGRRSAREPAAVGAAGIDRAA